MNDFINSWKTRNKETFKPIAVKNDFIDSWRTRNSPSIIEQPEIEKEKKSGFKFADLFKTRNPVKDIKKIAQEEFRPKTAEEKKANLIESGKKNSFAMGLVDSATLGLNKRLLESMDKEGTNLAYDEAKKNKLAYGAGTIAGYVVPGAGVEKAAGKLLKPVLSKVGSKLAQKAITGAATGGSMELAEGVIRGESAKDIAKRTALGTGLGAGADVALYGVGKGIKFIADKMRAGKALTAIEKETLKNTPELLALPESKQYLMLEAPKLRTPDVIEALPSKPSIDDVAQLKTTPTESKKPTYKNMPISDVEKVKSEYEALREQIIENQINYLRKTMGKGVQKGSLFKNEIGDVVGRQGRISKNEKWYQEYFKQNRKLPNKKELRDISEKQLKEGYISNNGEIPPDEMFNGINKELNEVINESTSFNRFNDSLNKARQYVEAKRNVFYNVDPQFKKETPFTVAKSTVPQKVQPKFAKEFIGGTDNGLKPQEQLKGKSILGEQKTSQKVNKADLLKDDKVYKELSDDLAGTNIKGDVNIQNMAPSVKDKSGLTLNLKDVTRNLRDAFGKNFEYVKAKYITPLDQSKKRYVDEVKIHTDNIYNKVVKDLKINKGSKESAAVQNFGEKVKVVNGKKVEYGYSDLVKEFGKNKADNIVKADAIFRKQYDELIDKVNATRQLIYPGNAEKIVPKRTDYYRHFQEMAEGFEGLKNIFDSPSQIDPKLAGMSEFVKPKAKWASFMQKRGEGEYTADAVGGILNYVKAAAYSIHIDPNINSFRQLAKDLAEGTAESKNANNTIKWISDFANSLAGKTNKYDRVIQEDIPGGRTAFRAINWLNGRVKANQVLMNARSAVSQLANVPVSIAMVKNPVALAKGVGQTLASIAGKVNPAMKESQFINERYMDDLISRFDKKWLDQPKKLAAWLLTGFDKIGTGFTWNSAYNKAVLQGIKNPVQYADELTRSIVAGRGIGEVPLLQQAKTFQLIAPFQLEVANLWNVFGDSIKEKDFGAIALILAGNYVFNNISESVTGNRVTFDPVDAFINAMQEDSKTPLTVAGRLAGEVLSNVPLGQTMAAQYPEYGADISTPLGNLKLPSRKAVFGDEDPTRFGGGLLVAKAVTDPLYKILPPFGGAQLKKTIEGNKAVNRGAVEKDGKMRFPVANNLENRVKGTLFGQYGVPESKEYFDKDRRPLSENQTKIVKNSSDSKFAYDSIMKNRRIETLKSKIKDVQTNEKLSYEQKAERIKELQKLLSNVK